MLQVEANQKAQDLAYESLKQAIITGEIVPGSRIVETSFAKQMHLSRTPLRDALRRLQEDGLVECQPHRGWLVNAFTIDDVEEIFTIRNDMVLLLLPSVVEQIRPEDLDQLQEILQEMDVAQEQMDCDKLALYNRNFHSALEKISGKRHILRVIDSQEAYVNRFSAVTIANIVRHSKAHQEHHEMIQLLREKNLEKLTDLMRHHLQESKDTCLDTLEGIAFRRKE